MRGALLPSHLWHLNLPREDEHLMLAHLRKIGCLARTSIVAFDYAPFAHKYLSSIFAHHFFPKLAYFSIQLYDEHPLGQSFIGEFPHLIYPPDFFNDHHVHRLSIRGGCDVDLSALDLSQVISFSTQDSREIHLQDTLSYLSYAWFYDHTPECIRKQTGTYPAL